ncbi:hypothetical protein KY091_02130 [Chlamydia pecorum]|uniref:Uncharacterized protein n=1 Tax=Chlamydia pecorum (strain ATCC VR-628 / DSM 29919 / E58) TaxID=331635 RepID=A0AA34RD88_CHLPE|nr:hypothetical protein [Chlamydia pecorum]AEB41591.1 hypothetical protein G5S_0630 [Chlamydia pecorum E58]UFP07134.1 hypothetical protein KY091_02130 [Chlamydia pecorum]
MNKEPRHSIDKEALYFLFLGDFFGPFFFLFFSLSLSWSCWESSCFSLSSFLLEDAGVVRKLPKELFIGVEEGTGG